MNLDNVFRARKAMEPIDVLRQNPEVIKVAFHLSQHLMPAVEPSIASPRLDLCHVFPSHLGSRTENGSTQSFFDRNPVFGILIVVKPANTAIDRQPRISRDSRPSDHENLVRIAQQLNDLVDGFVLLRVEFGVRRAGHSVFTLSTSNRLRIHLMLR